ncbi:MAG: Spy/CpxP family protein refolding chaperone, partial [Gemmatimonadales bacterium]
MSRFRTAAIGVVVVLGMAGVAGAQAQARPDSAQWNRRHGQMGQGGRHMGKRGGSDGHGKLMADLKLTVAQKNQINAIHTKYEPQMKAIREQGKSQFGSMRDMRQKGDTSAAARAKFQQQREQFRAKSMTVRQAEERDVRAILT